MVRLRSTARPRPTIVGAIALLLLTAWPLHAQTQIPAQGGGEDCLSATTILALPFSDSGTTCGAGNDYDSACPFSSTSPDVVYAYTPTANVSVDVSLCGNSAYDTKLFVYVNGCPGTVIGCSEDECTTPSYTLPFVSRLSGLTLLVGNTYYFVIDGYDGACGDYTIDVTLNGGDFGACCDDATGTCVDGVQLSSCPQPKRFTPNATCADLGPACGLAPGPCCHGDGTCAIVTADQCTDGVWLGPYATCDMCPCVLPCPDGAISENESCGVNTNGGCPMSTPAFVPLAPGQSICGTVWQSAGNTDTDWYQVTLAAPMILSWSVAAEFPVFFGMLGQYEAGVPGCSNLTGYFSLTATGANDCLPAQITSGPLPAGTYYLEITAGNTSPINCSTQNRYVLTLKAAEVHPQIRVEPAALTFNCTGSGSIAAAQKTATIQATAVSAAIGTAGTQADFTPPSKLIDANEIQQTLAQGNGRAKVIVNLKRPVDVLAATNFRDAHSRGRLRKEVGHRQDAVLGGFAHGEFTLRQRYGNMASFSGAVSAAGLARLQADPRVVSIEPVREVQAHLRQGIALIHGLAQRSTYNGAGVAIAICDTGIDYTHPMLGGGTFPNAKVIGGYDFGNDDADPKPAGQAHGTCCAGIAAGDWGDVGDYIGGVAPNAKLYALKIAADYSGSASTDDIVAAWDWCVTHQNDDPNNPILVISTSFGGGHFAGACDSTVWALTTAANNAAAAGITLVCSSGNDGYCDGLSWPACISSVLSVGAVYDASFGTIYPCVSAESCAAKSPSGGCVSGYLATDTSAPDRVASFSNTADILTLLAPANQAYTTDLVGATGYNTAASPTGDYYAGFSGTSAACPYAAGAVACLQQAAKAITGEYLSPLAVKAALTANGDDLADPKAPDLIKPRINLERAINSLAPCDGQKLTIYNDGTVPLTISSVLASTWLTPTPQIAAAYSIPPGSQMTYCINVNCTAGCIPGVPLQGRIEIASDDPNQPALGIAVQATCPPTPADFDQDGDVDPVDVTLFMSCFSGPGVPRANTALCLAADLDHDNDVDQDDYGRLQKCFSGPDRRANPACND